MPWKQKVRKSTKTAVGLTWKSNNKTKNYLITHKIFKDLGYAKLLNVLKIGARKNPTQLWQFNRPDQNHLIGSSWFASEEKI